MNLILSVAAGYNWKQLEIFIKSLRKCYAERVVLILNNPDFELTNKLNEFNIEFVKTDIIPKESILTRHSYYIKYLENNREFKNVFLTDSRDVFFQNNPFQFNYKNCINFFLEDEIIKNSSVNKKWIMRTVGKKELNKISNNYISCCGTVMGKFNNILNYCKEMKNHIEKFPYKRSLHSILWGRKNLSYDQGIQNYLVYSGILKNIGFYNNQNGNVANLHTSKLLKFNAKNRLVNIKEEEYSVVHQYDRFNEYFENFVKEIKDL
jgi:hypothetical protein